MHRQSLDIAGRIALEGANLQSLDTILSKLDTISNKALRLEDVVLDLMKKKPIC